MTRVCIFYARCHCFSLFHHCGEWLLLKLRKWRWPENHLFGVARNVTVWVCLCLSVWAEILKFAEGDATQYLRTRSRFNVSSMKAVEILFWFMSELPLKTSVTGAKWLTCRPLNNHKCFVFRHMYSFIHYSKWREQNQFHASGCFCEIVLFLTCSAPPWALHLEDCKPSPVGGRPGTEWGALAPRGPARPWTGTASPLSSRWSRSGYGGKDRLVMRSCPTLV